MSQAEERVQHAGRAVHAQLVRRLAEAGLVTSELVPASHGLKPSASGARLA